MSFKTYFFGLGAQERKEFAIKVGTSVGHLNNFCYGYTSLKPVVCVAVERESGAQVTRRELRPKDWQDIWPELVNILPDSQQAVHPKPIGTSEDKFDRLADSLTLQDRRQAQQPFDGPDKRLAGLGRVVSE